MDKNNNDSMGIMMNDVHQQLIPRVQAAFQKAGFNISCPQFGLMLCLEEGNEVILNDIAMTTGKDKSTVLRHVDHLEALGYVQREADQVDRRRKQLVLTESGRQALLQAKQVEKALYDHLFSGVAEDDKQTFYNVLLYIKRQALLMGNGG